VLFAKNKTTRKEKQNDLLLKYEHTFALYKPYIQASFYMEYLYTAIRNQMKTKKKKTYIYHVIKNVLEYSSLSLPIRNP